MFIVIAVNSLILFILKFAQTILVNIAYNILIKHILLFITLSTEEFNLEIINVWFKAKTE